VGDAFIDDAQPMAREEIIVTPRPQMKRILHQRYQWQRRAGWT